VSATEPHYGLPTVAHVDARPHRSNLVPVLVLFVGLAVAAIWFVGRPAFATPSPASRACERVVVHDSGSATCVTRSDRVIRTG
jgi:hypothetical protein